MKKLIFGFAFIAIALVFFTNVNGGVGSVSATSTPAVIETSSSYPGIYNGFVVEANYNIRKVSRRVVFANYMTTQYMTSSIEITDEDGNVEIYTNEMDGLRAGIEDGLVSYHTVGVRLPYGTYSIRPMSIWKGMYTSFGRSTTLTIE